MVKIKAKAIIEVLSGLFIIYGSVQADFNQYSWWAIDKLNNRNKTIIDVNEEDHNCRMWAAISNGIADSVIYNHLIEYPNSLKNLSQSRNIDGWGFAYYPDFGDSVVIERGAVRACNDPAFDSVVIQMEILKPKVSLAHIRQCSEGCCCHGCDSIPDPHPFWRDKNNKSWSFAHNGTIDKSLLYDLIGEEYLEENPLNGSDIPECDPTDTSMVIDSELYFLYLLKHIEENNWNITDGVIEALVGLLLISTDEAMNFILSDGYCLWAFCKARTLYYLDDSLSNYCAVASMYPSESQDDWQQVNDYELVVLSAGEAPIVINIGVLLPSIAGVVTDEESNTVENAYVFIEDTLVSDTTNINGEYFLGCLSLDIYDVSFKHTYYSDTVVSQIEVFAGDTTFLDVVMKYPGTIAGIVTNDESDPVENVYVFIEDAAVYDTTDSNGEYFLEHLNLGIHDAYFTHPYYSDSVVVGIEVFADSITVLDVTLSNPGTIAGIVTNDESDPVESVYVFIEDGSINDTTDSNGEYYLDSLNLGIYDISFTHLYYSDTIVVGIEVFADSTTVLGVIMSDPGLIMGVVTNEEFSPVENVNVFIEGTSINDTTDNDGEFILDSLDLGIYHISFSHPDYYDTTVTEVEVTSGDTTTLDVVMEELPGVIAGIVSDDSSDPIEGVYVIAVGTLNNDSTDINGEYSLDSLEAGNYDVSFSHPDYYPDTVTGVEITPGDTTTVDVRLIELPGWITGVVTDEMSNSIDSVYVTAIGTTIDDYTDSSGEYSLDSLEAGTYTIAFSHPDYYPDTVTGVDVTPDDTTTVNVVMEFPCDYVPGDINGDDNVMGNDVTYGVRYFKGIGEPPPDSCWNAEEEEWLYSGGDANGNCSFTGSDVTFLVAYFKGYNPEILWCPQTPPAEPPVLGIHRDVTPVGLPKK